MKLCACIVLVALLPVAPLHAAQRLTDREVKALVSFIDEGRDRFEDALDDRLKRSVVRGPNGEVDVSRFLDDFEENIERLEERLSSEYAASTEVATVLRQASAIDRFFRQQPTGTRGESEWNRLASDLKTLAAAYGAEFPLGDNATVRRVGDRELAGIADDISRTADRLKKALDDDLKRDKTLAKTTRESIVREADLMAKDAREVRRRLRDGKPSSAEASRLTERAMKVRAFLENRQGPGSAREWAALEPRMQTLASAYGMTLATAR